MELPAVEAVSAAANIRERSHDLRCKIAVPNFPDETHIPATATAAPQMSCHVSRTGGPSISIAMEQSPFAVGTVSLVDTPRALSISGWGAYLTRNAV